MFRSRYIDCLIKDLSISDSLGNPTYTPTTHTKEEILDNHRPVCVPPVNYKSLEMMDMFKSYFYNCSYGVCFTSNLCLIYRTSIVNIHCVYLY